MNLVSLGRLVAQRRRIKRLTLTELATVAGIGRSTLAALEAGRLNELGFTKVSRVCDAVGLVLEVRDTELAAPLMPHRHLTERAGRELTKAAIADIIERGDIRAWRGLVQALRTGNESLAGRVGQVLRGLDAQDSRVRALSTLLPSILSSQLRPAPRHD